MVNKTSSVAWSLRKGYSLIELVVVLAIITFMGMLTFFGFGNQNKDQRVLAAEREIIVNLRSIQTKVDSGVGGANYKTATFRNGDSFYTLDGTTINLTPGVKLSLTTTPVTIYFSHPSLACYSTTCGAPTTTTCGASATIYFACGGSPVGVLSPLVTIGFVGSTRTIKIEGSGMNVNRIYE